MGKVAVTAVVEHKGQILVGKKIKLDGHFLSGKWHIPGGKVDEGEDEKQALIREMHEETGIDIRVGRFIDEFLSESGTLVKWYLCEPVTFDLKPGDDLEEVSKLPKKVVEFFSA